MAAVRDCGSSAAPTVSTNASVFAFANVENTLADITLACKPGSVPENARPRCVQAMSVVRPVVHALRKLGQLVGSIFTRTPIACQYAAAASAIICCSAPGVVV